jgi:transposase
MLAEVVDAVVGGDTHRDTHALELTAPSGATIATLMIGNDERGFAEAIAWIAEHAPGPRVVVGLEGTRSYGIGLARVLQAAGLTVVEIERPRRGERRRGKSDPIDAHLAALHALRLDADRLPTPRADGDREALRILLGARRELTTAKTRTITHLAPQLLAKRGVGPVSAAQAIVTWSHPGRCRNDAAYAALAGASPIPASSGRIVRHRLNRGGDRHLNRTLHDILLTRWRTCQRTQAYITRRRAEGKTDPEIRRCLKRYIARELYRCLNTAMTA